MPDDNVNECSNYKIVALTERVDNWINTTVDYRKQLCDKIDDIRRDIRSMEDVLHKLPCEKRWAWYNSMNTHVKVLWTFMSALVLAIVIEFLRHKP